MVRHGIREQLGKELIAIAKGVAQTDLRAIADGYICHQ